MNQRNLSVRLLYLTFSTIVFVFFYKSILLAPNDYSFGYVGDASKNYYSVAYHLKNDSSYTYFQGGNYPFVEHVIYQDGQFLLASIMKKAKLRLVILMLQVNI